MTRPNHPDDENRFDEPSDDPRLTAYALGELAGPEHALARAAIEARIASDPAARTFVEETRGLAVTLRDGYLAAPAASLTDAQRAAVMARAAAPATTAAPRGRVLRVSNWSVPVTIAAAALVGVTFGFRHDIGRWWSGDRETARAGDFGLRYVANAERARRAAETAALRDGNAVAAENLARESGRPGTEHVEFPGESDEARAASAASASQPIRATKARFVEREVQPGSSGSAEASGPGANAPPPTPAPQPKPASAAAPLPGDFTAGVTAGGAGGSPANPSGHRSGGGGGGGRPRSGGGSSGPPGGTGIAAPVVPTRANDPFDAGPVRVLGDVPIAGTLLVLDEDGGQRRQDAVVLRHAASGSGGVVLQLGASGSGGIAERTARVPGTESYARFADNPFLRALDAPLSTFGIDVDTASYANVRRFLSAGQLPPPQAVRIEEMVNYFPYRYAPPTDGSAFAANVEVAGCPWDASHRLVRVALKGRVEDLRERPAANLVFLIDVSGSMEPENKLPLLLQSMRQLVPSLGERDKVAIVTYAGEAGVALPPTRGDQKDTILAALDKLRAGGSTNGAAGIETAYRLAAEGFVPGGVNRVILATDGDFNVGVSDDDALVRIIEEKAKSKVFLTVLGFGEGNFQDKKMEGLADRGNGNFAYIDSLREGRKVLVDEAASTLVTIAKDVKLQIEFNPVRVASYRLVGYENRTMAAADFANDAKDAGDLGSGHSVTALYEIVPTGGAAPPGTELRYQRTVETTTAAHSDELCVVKLRWKLPEGDVSTYREIPVTDSGASYAQASGDFKFAAAVASFGLLLRGSPYRGQASFDAAMELATEGLDHDPKGLRAEFVDLVRKAKSLSGR